MNDMYLGAYWKPRQESADECTGRLFKFLNALKECDPVFSSWFGRGRSRRDAVKREIEFNERTRLHALLEAGRNRRDSDRQVIDELGFQIGMWNGRDSRKSAGLTVTCGLYSLNPNLGNCVVLDLPQELGELRHGERMATVLVTVAESWEPDWAGVISRQSRSTRDFVPGIPFVDWMLYLSDTLVHNPSVPMAYSVTRVDEIGSLIVVQREPVDPGSPEQIHNIKTVEAALGKGLWRK